MTPPQAASIIRGYVRYVAAIRSSLERDDFTPRALAHAIRTGETALDADFQIRGAAATQLVAAGEPLARELEELTVRQAVTVQLDISAVKSRREYRALKDLSRGQRATALLLLLLGASRDPLIIDQPEDDLDNRFVFDGIVHHLRDLKGRRQVIVSTHNANVPVLGDAELIIALESNGSTAGPAEGGIGSLDRLAYLGHRTMGALTFEPEVPRAVAPSTALDMRRLTEEARRAVEGRLDGDDTAGALADLLAVGTSAAGARAKAVIALDPQTSEVRAGTMPVEPRFEQWLLKFDVASVDKGERTSAPFCRIEYAYFLMGRQAGIEMTESRLLQDGPLAHFLTRRFDRHGDERVHMASLCGLAHLDFDEVGVHDYAQLFATVDALGLDEVAREQVFRRMAFNVAAVNHDDHTKNVAFLMDRTGSWRLAPAYDLTFAASSGDRWLAQHLMGVDGRFDGITTADLLRLADRFAVPNVKHALREVREAVAAWPEHAGAAGLDSATTAAITDQHRAAAI